MHRPRAFRSHLALMALLSLATAADAKPARKLWPVNPASDAAGSLLTKAYVGWSQIELVDPENTYLVTCMNDAVLKPLSAARDNDPTNPLIASKFAEMLAVLNPSDPRIDGALDDSFAQTQDWVPGWLARGEIALLRGRTAEARQHFNSARNALGSSIVPGIEGLHKTIDQPILFLGIRLNPAPQKPRADDGLTDDDRLALLLSWMTVSEAWSITNGRLDLTQPQTLDTHALLRRLNARVNFGLFRCDLAERDAAGKPMRFDEVERGFTEVFELDANYFPARRLRIQLAVKHHQYELADSLVRPYVDADPKSLLHHYPPMLMEAAQLYFAWNKVAPSEEATTKFDEANGRLLDRDASFAHFSGWTLRAQMYMDAAAITLQRDRLTAAEECLSHARESPSADPAQLRELTTRLDRLRGQVVQQEKQPAHP